MCLQVTCRHLEKSSDRLFKIFFFLPFINCSFSSRHRLHLLEPTLYAGTFFMIDHVMLVRANVRKSVAQIRANVRKSMRANVRKSVVKLR